MNLWKKDDSNNFTESLHGVKRRRIIMIIAILVFLISVIILAVASQPTTEQRKNEKLANNIKSTLQTATGNSSIVVSGVKTFGKNFISASINLGRSGYIGIYKDDNGKITEVLQVQGYDIVALLQAGLTLDDISHFYGNKSVSQIKDDLVKQCGSSEDTVGLSSTSFRGVKTNGTWSLDDQALSQIQGRLAPVIQQQSQGKGTDNQIACVAAEPIDNAQVVNPNVNVVTSWTVDFITKNGQITKHDMSYTVDMNFNTTIMLDGQAI